MFCLFILCNFKCVCVNHLSVCFELKKINKIKSSHFFLSDVSDSGGIPTTITVPFSMSFGAAIIRGSSLQRLFLVCITQSKISMIPWTKFKFLKAYRLDKSLEEVLAEQCQSQWI